MEYKEVRSRGLVINDILRNQIKYEVTLMIDIFSECPVMENNDFKLRLVSKEDNIDLLAVYSDARSQIFFNSDNCNGDKFQYMTSDEMVRAIDFWIYSFNYKWFVRWSIIDKNTQRIIGTVEAFKRESKDSFSGSCLFRLDLRHDYEKYSVIKSILDLTTSKLYELFKTDRLITKGFDQSLERTKALISMGFSMPELPLIGNYDTYYNYWIRENL